MNYYRASAVTAQDNAPAYTARVNNTLASTNMAFSLKDQRSFNSEVIIGKNVFGLSQAFKNCSNLNSPVTIDESGRYIEDISGMFSGCENFNQPIVLNGGYCNCAEAFADCKSFEGNVNLNLYDPQGLNNPNATGLFQNCYNLKGNVTVGLGNLSQLITADNMFKNCYMLKDNIYLNNIAGEGIFGNCRNLKSFNVLSGIINVKTKYARNLFENCYNLEYFSGAIFADSPPSFSGLSRLNAPISLYVNAGCQMDGVFRGCSNLNREIYISNNDSIRVWSGCYQGCQQLQRAQIGNYQGAHDFQFDGCYNLRMDIDIYGTNSTYGYAFRYCNNLQNVRFSVTLHNWNFQHALDSCTNLANLTMNGFDVSNNVNLLLANKNKQKILNIHLTNMQYTVGHNSLEIVEIMLGSEALIWDETYSPRGYINYLWNVNVKLD